ncbi:MAG: TonB-dependent receptor [Deltaproteobacteria bacterium]|nr:TonB-dependent receptor [Deltaproteobacteria bacterium]
MFSRSLKVLPLLLLAALVALPVQAANLGLIDGSVSDYEGQPLGGIKILLLSKGKKLDEHIADARGHFEFEQVPFGTYVVQAIASDGRTDQRDLKVASGEVALVELFLPIPGQVIDIIVEKPKAPPPVQGAATVQTMDRHDIQSLPKGDTASVNEILQSQPGFVGDAMGNIFARGNHANVQYQIDGVPIPDSVSGLFGGFLSPKSVESMEVMTGGLNAEYGERLAAVVNLNSRRFTQEGSGEVELQGGSFQTVNPSISYGRQVGPLQLSGGLVLKRTDRALDPPTFNTLLNAEGDEQRGFLRIDHDPSEHTHLSLLGLVSHNFYGVPLDPTLKPYDPNQPDGGRTPDRYGNDPAPYTPLDAQPSEDEKDFFGLFSVRHDFDPRSSLRVSLTFRRSDAFLFGDAVRALGPTADPCVTDNGTTTCQTASDVRREANRFGFTAEQLFRLGEHHVLKFGGQVDQLFGKTAFTAYTRGDQQQGVDPSQTKSGTDDANATTGGVFVQDRATLGKWILTGGLRLDAQRVSFSGDPTSAFDVGFSPRFGAAYAVSENTVLRFSTGVLWMPPPPLDAPAAARILGVVAPDQIVPYDLKPEQDVTLETGIESRVLPELSLKFNAWGRLGKNVLDDVQIGATNLLSPYNFRDGRAGGLEAGATLVLGAKFNAFTNLSLQEAEGRGIASAQYLFSTGDLANDSWQRLDHSQVFTGNLGATVRDNGTTLTALAAYNSGLRTGPDNDQNVPGYLKVDLTLQHQFLDAPLKPTVSVDVDNLFDKHYYLRIGNGFAGSHVGAGRSVFVRMSASL